MQKKSSFSFFSFTIIFKLLFNKNGKGLLASIAKGVNTGKI